MEKLPSKKQIEFKEVIQGVLTRSKNLVLNKLSFLKKYNDH